ncbi:hypothetical protein D5S17_32935 [Pseudonocardiaceae bacterium YIM PH 21723]|nr:hypothetical protein D5S17_32935 [Pseudonocardiaceae bacterium YIM PH 21723]
MATRQIQYVGCGHALVTETSDDARLILRWAAGLQERGHNVEVVPVADFGSTTNLLTTGQECDRCGLGRAA